MRVLFLHQNFPGQFAQVARAWSRRPGWQVRAIGHIGAPGMPGFEQLHRYRLARTGLDNQHRYLRMVESATLHGQAAARAMTALRQSGFTPDAIVAHPGWGETLYAKEIYPQARLVHLCEWYYAEGSDDAGFDPEFPLVLDDRARTRTWNMLHALNLMQCDAAVSPTHWQRSRHPAMAQPKIAVQHEGIDTLRLRPDSQARMRTPNGTVLTAGDPVVTFVARNLEPYRGFHVFMRALERMQRDHSRVHALIVGGDEVSYGRKPADAACWRERMLREVSIDPERTHFLGKLAYADYLRVLQVSAAHVYLTYPFVLSWSMLEAMACGALVIGSDTPPVQEVLRHGDNGVLVPFFGLDDIASAALAAVEHPLDFARMRQQARADVQRYGVEQGVAGYDRLLLPG